MKRSILAVAAAIAFSGCGGDKKEEEEVCPEGQVCESTGSEQEGDEGDVGPDDPAPLPPDEVPPIEEDGGYADTMGVKLLKAGLVLKGKPYVFGGGRSCKGASCKNSDCSGMIYQAHLALNYLDLKKIRASARSQWKYFLTLSGKVQKLQWNPDNFRPGDQLFWRSGTRTNPGEPSHTGYYYGKNSAGKHLVYDCAPSTGCSVRTLSGWLANKSYIIGATRHASGNDSETPPCTCENASVIDGLRMRYE